MKARNVPLTEEQFTCIGDLPGWQVYDIPQEDWHKIPGLQRMEDTVAVMSSVGIDDVRILNGVQAIAGIDVLVHERKPKIGKGEPEGNAYHFVVQKTSDAQYPYIMHGPFLSGTRVSHWFRADDLNVYWTDTEP